VLTVKQVLAWGERGRLFHARQMILAAQWQSARDKDDSPDLLKMAHETLPKVEAELSDAKGKAKGSEKDVTKGHMTSKDKDGGIEHQ
jgi:hypothetical protein